MVQRVLWSWLKVPVPPNEGSVPQRVSFGTRTEPSKIMACAVPFCCPIVDGMKYGYARVSTDDQSPALQLAALKRAGRKTIFKDEGS